MLGPPPQSTILFPCTARSWLGRVRHRRYRSDHLAIEDPTPHLGILGSAQQRSDFGHYGYSS